tara:strand:+ start:513 stop:764 length:252 start_codon:yes stop_codon:yes gene_type:complete
LVPGRSGQLLFLGHFEKLLLEEGGGFFGTVTGEEGGHVDSSALEADFGEREWKEEFVPRAEATGKGEINSEEEYTGFGDFGEE